MARIPDQVAENRESARRLDGQFVTLPETARINLNFARNTIEVAVSLDIYTRPLNTNLISGHPDGSQYGSSFGESGDARGAYSAKSITVQSKEWTKTGRDGVRDALNGEATGAIREIAVGTGTAAAGTGDTALGTETGRTVAYGLKDSSNVVRARGTFRFSEDGLGGSDATEFGLFSDGGDLLARVVTDPITVSEDEELRADITLTVTGSGVGDSEFTNDGEAVVADAIRSPGTVVGIAELALGTDDTSPSKSDSALGGEVLSKDTLREKSNESIEATIRVLASEPSSQPVTLREIGAKDNNGNLLWRAIYEDRDKDESYGFDAGVGFRMI